MFLFDGRLKIHRENERVREFFLYEHEDPIELMMMMMMMNMFERTLHENDDQNEMP